VLKLTYRHLGFQNFSRGYTLDPLLGVNGEERRGKGMEDPQCHPQD